MSRAKCGHDITYKSIIDTFARVTTALIHEDTKGSVIKHNTHQLPRRPPAPARGLILKRTRNKVSGKEIDIGLVFHSDWEQGELNGLARRSTSVKSVLHLFQRGGSSNYEGRSV